MKGLVFPVIPAAQSEEWDSGRREQMNGGGGCNHVEIEAKQHIFVTKRKKTCMKQG